MSIASLTSSACCFRGTCPDPYALLLLVRWQERVLESLTFTPTIDASVLSPGHLLGEWTNQALRVAKSAQFFLSLHQGFRVIVPGIRHGAHSFPVVTTWYLISLRLTLPMIELSRDVHHAKSQRFLCRISVAVDEDIVVGAILLDVRVLDGAGDVCVAVVFRERVAYLGFKLRVPVGDVVNDFKTFVVQFAYRVVK